MELIKIEHIRIEHPKYKEHEDTAINSKLKKSIVKNGQLKNIVVHRDSKDNYLLIEGESILRIMKELGETKIWCKVLQKMDEYNMLKLKVILNDTTFPVDYVSLAEIVNKMRSLMPFSDNLNDLPYTKAQIDKFKHIFEFDWEQFEEDKKTMVDPNQMSMFDILAEVEPTNIETNEE